MALGKLHSLCRLRQSQQAQHARAQRRPRNTAQYSKAVDGRGDGRKAVRCWLLARWLPATVDAPPPSLAGPAGEHRERARTTHVAAVVLRLGKRDASLRDCNECTGGGGKTKPWRCCAAAASAGCAGCFRSFEAWWRRRAEAAGDAEMQAWAGSWAAPCVSGLLLSSSLLLSCLLSRGERREIWRQCRRCVYGVGLVDGG